MATTKSSDLYKQIIASLLCDVHTLHSEFTARALKLTTQKVEKRIAREGLGFLTKTLPRLGKALDRALTGEVCIDSAKLGFKPMPSSKLPIFMGELFSTIFSHDGRILPTPNVTSIKSLRQLFFVFYKLELPYDSVQEQRVIEKFIETDQSLEGWNIRLGSIADAISNDPSAYERVKPRKYARVIRIARRLLSDVFTRSIR